MEVALKAPALCMHYHMQSLHLPCCYPQVFEWLTWAAAELAYVSDEKLQHINDYLATRTFLAGSCTTLADLVVFGTVHPAVVRKKLRTPLLSLKTGFGICMFSGFSLVVIAHCPFPLRL